MTDSEKLRRAVDEHEFWGEVRFVLVDEVKRLRAENAELREELARAERACSFLLKMDAEPEPKDS